MSIKQFIRKRVMTERTFKTAIFAMILNGSIAVLIKYGINAATAYGTFCVVVVASILYKN